MVMSVLFCRIVDFIDSIICVLFVWCMLSIFDRWVIWFIIGCDWVKVVVIVSRSSSVRINLVKGCWIEVGEVCLKEFMKIILFGY